MDTSYADVANNAISMIRAARDCVYYPDRFDDPRSKALSSLDVVEKHLIFLRAEAEELLTTKCKHCGLAVSLGDLGTWWYTNSYGTISNVCVEAPDGDFPKHEVK